MNPTLARPKASPKRAGGAPASRKRDDALRDLPPTVTRLDPALRDRLDAIVAARNAELATAGAATSRGALIALAVREFCDREDAKAGRS